MVKEGILHLNDNVTDRNSIRGRIIAFEETIIPRFAGWQRKPGVYENKAYVQVESSSGERSWVSSYNLNLLDHTEEERRLNALQKEYGNTPIPQRYLRELPETKYYERDVVKYPEFKIKGGHHVSPIHSLPIPFESLDHLELVIERAEIQRIEYFPHQDGRPQGYVIKGTTVLEPTLKLLRRGNVWKYYHGEPLIFRGLEEELDFFRNLGHFEEVKNPRTNLFSWDKNEYLSGIITGVIDAPYYGSPFNICEERFSAIRFRDEELGARVRTEIVSRMHYTLPNQPETHVH